MRQCLDLSDPDVKTFLSKIMHELEPATASNPPFNTQETPSSQEEIPTSMHVLLTRCLDVTLIKRQGRIGEASQKDKISFISLM